MAYRFRIAPEALDDADRVFAWLAKRSPRKARQWYTGLFDAIETLKVHPHRCSLAPESDAFQQEIRQLFYGKRRSVYRILFTIRGDEIHVFRIRHGAQAFLEPGEPSNGGSEA